MPMTTTSRLMTWPLLVGLGAVAYACIEARYLFLDADTLWHLRTGEWIWSQQRVPATDPFSHTFYGQPWIAHEWLAGVIFFLLFSLLGLEGPAALTALAFGLTVGLIAQFLFNRLEPARALLVAMLVLASLATHLLARPHMLAMPILALWIIQLVNAVEQQKTPPIWLAALMVLWANLHGSFVVGLMLAGLFAIEAVIATQPSQRKAMAKQWIVFIVVIALASILTPYQWHGWLFPFQLKSMSFALSIISEWVPPNFQKFEPQEAWILGLFFLGWALKIRVSWIRLALLGYVMHLSLAHTRHLTLLAIIAPIILATAFREALGPPGRQADNNIDRFMNRLQGRSPIGVAIGLSLAIVAIGLIPYQDRIKPPDAAYPEKAMAFLRENPPTGKVFNSYGLGGALIYARIPVFIDGRADMYKDPFIKEHFEASRGIPGKLPGLLQAHDVAWTFLDAKGPAAQIMDLMPGWSRIYSDEQVVIHQQNPKI